MRATRRVALIALLAACGIPAQASAAGRDLFHNLFPPPPLIVADPPLARVSLLDMTPAPATSLDAAPVQNEPSPKPEHTGFGALVRSTASDFAAFPRRKSTWVILGIGAGAAAIAHTADDYVQEHAPGSSGADKFFKLGKYLGSAYVETGVAVGLYAIGRFAAPATKGAPRTNKLSHLGFDLVRGIIVSQAFTQGIKYAVRRDRPTGECCAFPSGHASTAFATASILERHLGYRGAWPTVVGASYVALSRITDNRHFLSDVVFGSALGIATGWTVVGRHGRENYAFVPVPVRGGVALTFTRVDPRGAKPAS